MLSLFPELFTYSFFAPTVLRLALAFFCFIAIRDMRRREADMQARWGSLTSTLLWFHHIAFAALGILFLVGLYTQLAALIGIIAALKGIVLKRMAPRFALWAPRGTLVYLFVLAVSFSLLLLGPGFLAFDLPL